MKRSSLSLFAVALWGCGRSAGLESQVPKPNQAALKGCIGQSVVMLQEHRTLVRAAPEGVTPLFRFGEGVAESQVWVSDWEVSPTGFVAAHASLGTAGPSSFVGEIVLIAPDGKPRFTERSVGPHSPTLFLGEDGSLAVAGVTGRLIRSDGSVVELGDLLPITPQLPGGELVVTRGEYWKASVTKGVWKDGVFTPLTLEMISRPTVVGSHVVTVSGSALVSLLDGRSFKLPSSQMQVMTHSGGRFVMLNERTTVVLVDLLEGSVQSVTPVPSPHQRYQAWDAALQSDGSVLASFEVGNMLQLKRSVDRGSTWVEVGEPMRMGQDFGLGRWVLAVERQGTVMGLSMSTGYGHYVNELQLTSASGAHRLATGEVYVNASLLPGAADLSADGQCVAAWVVSEPRRPGRLVFMDTEGRQRDVLTDAEPEWFRFMP